MCSTFSTSAANWIVLRQLRSVWTTTLAMLRWTNTSPGCSPVIWFAGTRESEQPIHRYFGFWICDRRLKKPGSSARMRSAQALLRSSSSLSGMASSTEWAAASAERDGDVLGVGEEAHRFPAALAADAGRLAAAERRAQVALEPRVDPDDAGVDAVGEAMGAAEVARPHARREPVRRRVRQRERLGLVGERLQRHHRPEDFFGIAAARRAEPV